MRNESALGRLWPELKVWRKVRLGPVALIFGFRRAVRITQSDNKPRFVVARDPAPLGAGGRLPAPASEVRNERAATSGTAVIVGVGPGFGHALARRLAAEGFDLALVARDARRLTPLSDELSRKGIGVALYGADATDEQDVGTLFDRILERQGAPSLVVYSVQDFGPGNGIDISVPAFESAWRHNCLGAFLVARSAGKLMREAGRGSIFLVGSTSSIVGRAGYMTLAVGKFGQRALAQVLARELWPAGIHVAHVIVDAEIAEEQQPNRQLVQSNPEDIAQSILALHRQPRTAWSSEIDLRPWNEAFWEHC
jgi:NAD(P)-dependent dehydrogenase (short-subunit alcohol dehydrogenase family)